MEGADSEDERTDGDVVVCVASTEQLAPVAGVGSRLSSLEANRKSRLYSYLYG